jgi:hypothetical protein
VFSKNAGSEIPMFGSNTLEVAIGIIFVYLLLSLFCTAVNESIAVTIQQRGKNLKAGLQNLLNDPDFTALAQQLYNHGLVCGISRNLTNPAKAPGLTTRWIDSLDGTDSCHGMR